MPMSDEDIEEDGSVHDCSHRNAAKHIVSRDIISFSLQFYWNDAIGHSENGLFIPDEEQSYPQGLWQISLKKTDTAAELELNGADVIHSSKQVPCSILQSLQNFIEERTLSVSTVMKNGIPLSVSCWI